MNKIPTRRHPILRGVETGMCWWERHPWCAFIIFAVAVALVNCVVES